GLVRAREGEAVVLTTYDARAASASTRSRRSRSTTSCPGARCSRSAPPAAISPARFCQNWDMSKSLLRDQRRVREYDRDDYRFVQCEVRETLRKVGCPKQSFGAPCPTGWSTRRWPSA